MANPPRSKNSKGTAKRGRPFVPGDPRINRKGRPPGSQDEVRALLMGSAQEIHEALLEKIRKGSLGAILYAHQQLAGKAVEHIKLTGKDDGPVQVEVSDVRERILDRLAALRAARGGSEGAGQPSTG